jgi:predicted DNA-binding protein (UPF0278 family)
MYEGICIGVVAVQSTQASADPDISLLILNQGCDPAIVDAVWVLRVRTIGLEFVPIVTVQAILCAYPQKTKMVL